MSKKNYTVKTPVNHDQVDYAPGSHIELDETHAKPLLAIGAIEAIEENTESNKANKKK